MSLLFTDGFDDQMSAKKWTATDLTEAQLEDPGGRNGGLCARVRDGGSLHKIFGAKGEVVAGFALRVTYHSSDNYFFRIEFRLANAIQFSLMVNTNTGRFRLARGTSTSPTVGADVILDTNYLAPNNAWVYVEIRAVPSPTVGEIELRVDGVQIANLSGVNTGPGTQFDAVRFVRTLFDGTRIDDVYICDALGGINDTFLGDVEVRPIYPNGAGSRTEMTNSAGNSIDNHTYVNVPGDEATFVQGGDAVGDLYAMGDVGANDTILAVQQNYFAKMSDSGAQQARHLTRMDAVTYDGIDTPLGFEIQHRPLVLDQAPDDTPWTPAKFNAIEMGVEGRA